MSITFKFDEDGGFYAHDDDHKIIEYAEPGSSYAQSAKTEPEQVAEKMINNSLGINQSELNPYHRWYKERYEYMRARVEAIK